MIDQKLWGNHQVDNTVQQYIAGQDLRYDDILLPYDVRATKAHILMLNEMGHLDKFELKTLNEILEKIFLNTRNAKFKIPESFEDAHSYIEFTLSKACNAGNKIHFLRSRNDQVLTALRLYLLEQTDAISKKTIDLATKFRLAADIYKSIIMPGYTHMQPAMPTTVGMWLGSYSDAFLDTTILLQSVRKVLDQNPLGSGAGFGFTDQGIQPDRNITKKELGFARVQKNPMYCGMSRGMFELYLVQSIELIALYLSQFAQDMLLFTMKEFNFFSLPQDFTTGSSIMPQKNNYDCIELLRGDIATIHGYSEQIRMIIAKKSSGYQRDLQLTKKPCIEAIITILNALHIAELIVTNIKVHPHEINKKITPQLYATSDANKLVQSGLSFREAYHTVKKGLSNEKI
ncbi:MAG TPA: lyase family protein, partial [Candidatus Saccharibacteria bacterium]|nr:lyase family protein [Candidatus Saccharibacteria bacterium]